MRFTFVEAPAFTKQVLALFDDDAYRQLQQHLAAHPEAGRVIPGLHGLRKLRWTAQGHGKRRGARILYLLIPAARRIYLFALYTKGDITDLTAEQKKRLAQAVHALKTHHQP